MFFAVLAEAARSFVPSETMTEKQPEIQIDLDEATARGTYANLALITHSETEFVLDFVFLQPQTPRARVLSRVVTSPLHAKRFLWALKENLEKYEARFGAVKAGDPPDTPPRPVGFYQ